MPRSAVITGAGTGIGFATAVRLNRAGYELTVVGRRPDVLAEAADAIARQGGGRPVVAVPADVADAETAARVVDEHAARTGGVEAFVACAGAYELCDVRELTAQQWDATVDVHVRATVLACSAAARHMTRAGRGRIVLLSSVNGFHSEPQSIAYSAAKAAIISVVRSLAVDLAGSGIAANAVAPGWVTTPMTADHLAATTPDQLRRVNALGRAGTADEIANVISYLVLDAPEFLTGATIVVDGAQTAMAPMP
jgi:NAD(P)-dependent dehydrogenase (short-subunit alcohol dehydrogenase family)